MLGAGPCLCKVRTRRLVRVQLMSAPPTISRVSIWEWMQTVLLAANLAWTTLCLGGYRPETMIVTSALTGLLLALHFAAQVFEKNDAAIQAHPAGWLLLPFLLYAAANVLWVTPVGWLGWRDWFGWAEMIAVFWVVLNGVHSAAPRRVLFGTLVTLGVIVVALAWYQHFVKPDWLMLGRLQEPQFRSRASGSFGIPNSLAAFLLLLIPPIGARAFRQQASVASRWSFGVLGGIMGFGLVLTISRGAWLGLALALVVWPLTNARWGWSRRIGIAGAVLGAVMLAGGLLYALSPKIRDRLRHLVHDSGELSRPIMWRGAWQLFREHPVLGTGAGSYNILFEKYRPELFHTEPQWAHNEYLNTLSDYGAVGFGLLFGAGGVIAWRCRGRRREPADPACDWHDSPAFTTALAIGALAFALQLFVDFHFKIPALALAFATVAALIVQRAWPADRDGGRSPAARSVAAVVAVVVLLGSVRWSVPLFRAEALRYRADRAIGGLALEPPAAVAYRTTLADVRTDLARAVTLDPTNAQAWADVAYAASLWAHVEPARTVELGQAAEAAAERALARSVVAAEFWIRRGVARDMQDRWLEAGSDFTQAISLSPQLGKTWYYYAYHLSLKPQERGMADAALNFCLRLDPGNNAAIALRQHLAISSKAP
ncbi:MAG: O-antigen ligase domain-containing protein [Opitutus sp.]|nr:O-antigen ligase domain-containing protein [Opitutus sp.]